MDKKQTCMNIDCPEWDRSGICVEVDPTDYGYCGGWVDPESKEGERNLEFLRRADLT